MSRRVLTRMAQLAAVSILGACGDGGTGPSGTGAASPQVIASVVVTPAAHTLLSLGETVQLTATAREASGNTISGTTFTWSSSDASVATVSSSGLVTAVTYGSANITAAAGGVTSNAAAVTVAQAVDLATWTWVSGSTSINQPGVYGTQGVASGSNTPGARSGAASWIDASGNLWLFGGGGIDAAGSFGDLNDLWRGTPGN
ncbi:MAG: Ig-like domain-containing protein [Gemmatimonadetes bacterium]|nr:Ig-like domain-containing protein [Gemmatimonadota bacterium]